MRKIFSILSKCINYFIEVIKGKDHPTEITRFGTKLWRNKFHQFHRDNDLPAWVYKSGDQYWWQNDKCHRDGDKPAMITNQDDYTWFKNGKCHRDNNLPAVIYTRLRHCQWWIDGKCIREGQYTLKEINEWKKPYGGK